MKKVIILLSFVFCLLSLSSAGLKFNPILAHINFIEEIGVDEYYFKKLLRAIK